MQARSTLRLQTPRRRQRSRSPDPTTIRSSIILSTDLSGGQVPSPTPPQSTLSKRSKKRENQNPAHASSSHNQSRGHQNDIDAGPVARGDKSRINKPPNSKNRHIVNQSTEALSSTRTAVPGRRDKDRSLTRGESIRSSKRTPSVEPIEVDEDPHLTGPIAVAQYTRLQSEVEKLREVRSKHVMIDTFSVYTRTQQFQRSKKTIEKQSKVIDELRKELTSINRVCPSSTFGVHGT